MQFLEVLTVDQGSRKITEVLFRYLTQLKPLGNFGSFIPEIHGSMFHPGCLCSSRCCLSPSHQTRSLAIAWIKQALRSKGGRRLRNDFPVFNVNHED